MTAARRPSFIVHWTEVQEPDEAHHPGPDELFEPRRTLGKQRNAEIGNPHWNEDRPERPLGPHDGLPDERRR